MAEEQGCQEARHTLCANGCGFFGSPATLNLCSKCYRDIKLIEDQLASSAIDKSSLISSSPVIASPSAVQVAQEHGKAAVTTDEDGKEEGPRRCAACMKRVGLMGFGCRCGKTCCGAHRHPEGHGCTYDFRAVGREAIVKDNPVIKADKLHRI